MPFLTDDDYLTLIKPDLLAVLTSGNPLVRPAAERFAQSTAETHLRGRYDVVAVFAATGEGRDAEVLRVLLDIALYEIHARSNPQQVPELRQTRRDDAMGWLRDVRDGKMSTALPPLAVDAPSAGLSWGSNDPFRQSYNNY